MNAFSLAQRQFSFPGTHGGTIADAGLWLIRRTRASVHSPEQRLAGEREVENKLEVQSFIARKLRELGSLPCGWDGAAGSPLSSSIARQAYRAMERVTDHRTVFPFITPGEEGSVLFEWRAGAERLEIEFIPDEAPYVCYVDANGLVQFEGELGDEGVGHAEVFRALSVLSSRIWAENPGWKTLFS